MKKGIDQVLAEEGEAAERNELPDKLPEHVKVSRPNRAKATVVSVRYSTEELEQLQRAAEQGHLPVSTLIRTWTLDRLQVEEDAGIGSIRERLDRLEKAVFDRSA